MSLMVSFVLSFFPRGVLDEILNLIGSVSEGFPPYSYETCNYSILYQIHHLGLNWIFFHDIILSEMNVIDPQQTGHSNIVV